MTKHSERPVDEGDEFDFAYGPDFDIELFDETPIDQMPISMYDMRPWQRLDRYMDSKWLREELSDWDDWDGYFETH